MHLDLLIITAISSFQNVRLAKIPSDDFRIETKIYNSLLKIDGNYKKKLHDQYRFVKFSNEFSVDIENIKELRNNSMSTIRIPISDDWIVVISNISYAFFSDEWAASFGLTARGMSKRFCRQIDLAIKKKKPSCGFFGGFCAPYETHLQHCKTFEEVPIGGGLAGVNQVPLESVDRSFLIIARNVSVNKRGSILFASKAGIHNGCNI